MHATLSSQTIWLNFATKNFFLAPRGPGFTANTRTQAWYDKLYTVR